MLSCIQCNEGRNNPSKLHGSMHAPLNPGTRVESTKDLRLIGHLSASRFLSMVYCLFMPGQNLTGQKAILLGICPMASCYY